MGSEEREGGERGRAVGSEEREREEKGEGSGE